MLNEYKESCRKSKGALRHCIDEGKYVRKQSSSKKWCNDIPHEFVEFRKNGKVCSNVDRNLNDHKCRNFENITQ